MNAEATFLALIAAVRDIATALWVLAIIQAIALARLIPAFLTYLHRRRRRRR